MGLRDAKSLHRCIGKKGEVSRVAAGGSGGSEMLASGSRRTKKGARRAEKPGHFLRGSEELARGTSLLAVRNPEEGGGRGG